MKYDMTFRVTHPFEAVVASVEIGSIVFPTDTVKISRSIYGVILTKGGEEGRIKNIRGKGYFPDLFDLKKENFEKLAEAGFIEILFKASDEGGG